ncbi:MAG: hypothetical protein ACTH4U_09310 [Pseudoalteromonas prydzensis]|uniref:Fis family transcriptional regulator n=2 Tax=root TaxID=1 RepID=A0A7V1GGR8_9GAMM|nr:hypothetical protein [Pseudoalteromonas prydzensis]HEA19190.1 hypothetical protein [Pseudoalteromonas prydzensis]
MTKTQKQFDKVLRTTLTRACECIKDEVTEFSWLTHDIDIKKPATSLKISCFFKDQLALEQATENQDTLLIKHILSKELASIDLTVKEFIFTADKV